MSNTRKILSVVMAIIMAVSMFAISANAVSYENEEDAAINTQTWALGEPVDNGNDTYSVDVYLTTTYPTGTIEFVVKNTDNTVAKLVSATIGDAIPETYNCNAPTVSNASGKVTIYADTEGTGTITAEEIDGVIATLVYEYAGSGSADIIIDNNPKTATNPTGTLIAARMSDGDLVTGDYITGQNVVSVGEKRTIGGGAAVAPTLGVIDGTAGVIDTTRHDMYCDEMGEGTGDATFTGYIYGIEPEKMGEDTIDNTFEVIGDGELEVIPNEAGYDCGTGTIVNVLDTNDIVVETYVLVIFGDVNGDGVVDGFDVGDIMLHDAWLYETSSNGMRMEYAYQVLAADVNADYTADGFDVGDVMLHDAWLYENGSDGMRMYQADVLAMFGF